MGQYSTCLATIKRIYAYARQIRVSTITFIIKQEQNTWYGKGCQVLVYIPVTIATGWCQALSTFNHFPGTNEKRQLQHYHSSHNNVDLAIAYVCISSFPHMHVELLTLNHSDWWIRKLSDTHMYIYGCENVPSFSPWLSSWNGECYLSSKVFRLLGS